jgi:hypothetical protein
LLGFQKNLICGLIWDYTMKNVQNNFSKQDQDLFQIDIHFSELKAEAQLLFDLLNAYSSRINALEKNLQEIHANFPFRLNIKEGKRSILKQPLGTHIEGCAGDVHGFWTQDFWYLSWEADDNSKNFRLFLTIEELEFIFFDYGEHIEQIKEFCSNIKFKRPLIETNIQTRLQYSEYLLPFIDAFKDYLKSCRLAVEQGDVPF